MPSFREVLYAIQVCDTAADVQRHCGISPGRLRCVLRSERFRRQMEMERQYTDMRVRRTARMFARPAAEALISALRSGNDADLRKAAAEVLRLATRPLGITPDISGRLVDFTKLPPYPEDAVGADPAGGPSEPVRNPPPSLANPPLSLTNPPPSLANPSLSLQNGQNRLGSDRSSNTAVAASNDE